MTSPFFTIAIPTKNRPIQLANAVKSVLDQTFVDLEIIVCDNSDDTESLLTAERVRDFDDPRIRYIRTNGRLSMPDNWERAIADARGEFVGILTDRSVFRRNALHILHTEIEKTGARCLNWFNDLYGRDPLGTQLKRRGCTLKRYRLDRDTVLDYFVHGDPKYAPKIVPKLMTSVCHRQILEAIRASTAGRCCPPVAPDYTSGFLMLAHCDWILTVDEALYVSCGTGNGADFRRGGELADRFRRDLGMTWNEMVDRMPSDACFAHALILNDLMRVRDMVPDRLPNLSVDRAQYYLGCLTDYVKTAKHGVKRDEDLNALLSALENEAAEVRRQVQATRVYAKAIPPLRAKEKISTKSVDRTSAKDRERNAEPIFRFDNVFDALAWDEVTPREPIPHSFLDLMPRVDEMKKVRVPKALRKSSDVAACTVEGQSRERVGLRARVRGLLGRVRVN